MQIFDCCSNYSTGTRLPDEDDTTVQSLLAYHPKFLEKVGCGVAYIKVITLSVHGSFQDHVDEPACYLLKSLRMATLL